ncbi:MAG: hypothetical protein QY332_02295 [Anaerolineales bacterium]|nr:MAG: hypothetical protein QY332_02295 [Anaerolineales bacterium]
MVKPVRAEASVSAGSYIVFDIGLLFVALTLGLTPIAFVLRNKG